MMQQSEKNVYEVLCDCFEKGQFDDFVPFLSTDIVRTSMWDYEEIKGIEAMCAYFKSKEKSMAQNDHHFASLAILKYINNEPAGFSKDYQCVASKGSQAGDQEIPEGSQIVMYYPEGETVIVLKSNYLKTDDPVLIRLDINAQNKVMGYHIVNSALYAFEELDRRAYLSYHDLQQIAIQEAALYFHSLGYSVEIKYYYPMIFPHMILHKDEAKQMVNVMADHAPFVGKASEDLLKFFAHQALKTQLPSIVVYAKIIGLGDHPSLITKKDSYRCELMRILDVEAIKAQA